MVTITNKEIFNEMRSGFMTNQTQHEEIMEKLQELQGKATTNTWIASTALSLVIIVIVFLINKGG